MATCDNGHEPIQFAGEFSALCPLCQLKRDIREGDASAADRASKTLSDLELELGEVVDIISRLSGEIDEMRNNGRP